MDRAFKVFVISCMLLLSGCLATKALVVTENEKLSSELGYFIVSVTLNGKGDSTLLYRRTGGGELTRVDAFGTAATAFRDLGGRKGDFGSVLGKLRIVGVMPGNYEIKGFGLYNPRVHGWHFAKDLPPLPFEVKAGEVVYLGNMHVDARRGQNMFGINLETGATGSFRDKSKRDLPVLQRKYPHIDQRLVRVEPLSSEKWRGLTTVR